MGGIHFACFAKAHINYNDLVENWTLVIKLMFAFLLLFLAYFLS